MGLLHNSINQVTCSFAKVIMTFHASLSLVTFSANSINQVKFSFAKAIVRFHAPLSLVNFSVLLHISQDIDILNQITQLFSPLISATLKNIFYMIKSLNTDLSFLYPAFFYNLPGLSWRTFTLHSQTLKTPCYIEKHLLYPTSR